MVHVAGLPMEKMVKLGETSTNSSRMFLITSVQLDAEIKFPLGQQVTVLILGRCPKQREETKAKNTHSVESASRA